jgi:hypothetical protein
MTEAGWRELGITSGPKENRRAALPPIVYAIASL